MRLYQFLTAIDEKFIAEKNDLLKREPLPNLETAYREIRRAEARSMVLQRIPLEEDSSQGVGQGLAAQRLATKGRESGQGRGTAHSRGRGSQVSQRSGNQKRVEDKEGLL